MCRAAWYAGDIVLFSRAGAVWKLRALDSTQRALESGSKNKNRPLGNVNMADENLLSRSRRARHDRTSLEAIKSEHHSNFE